MRRVNISLDTLDPDMFREITRRGDFDKVIRGINAAQEAGLFDDEIVPVEVKGRKGSVTVTKDEHPRPGTTVEQLAGLTPVRIKADPEATVTAGNASGQNDGASACIVATTEMVEKYGLRPFGRLKTWAVAGVQRQGTRGSTPPPIPRPCYSVGYRWGWR